MKQPEGSIKKAMRTGPWGFLEKGQLILHRLGKGEEESKPGNLGNSSSTLLKSQVDLSYDSAVDTNELIKEGERGLAIYLWGGGGIDMRVIARINSSACTLGRSKKWKGGGGASVRRKAGS